jgi:hypothetical protein
MRPRLVLAFIGVVAALALGACKQEPAGGGGGQTATGIPPATSAPGSLGGASVPPPPPSTEPTAAGLEYRVSYDWGVPSSEVMINHPLTAPIAEPPLPPLPYLVGIYAANHPEGKPAYQRISFYFRGAFPSYRFRYVREVLSDGPGTPIPLQGNAFLQVGFVDAQAHDNAGKSTVAASPKNPMGYKNLKSYGFAGDFEGHVTYGLGIQAAPNSDQVLKIRSGELKKPDGSGGFFYVVHFDVETG